MRKAGFHCQYALRSKHMHLTLLRPTQTHIERDNTNSLKTSLKGSYFMTMIVSLAMASWTQAEQREDLYIAFSLQLSVIIVNANWS